MYYLFLLLFGGIIASQMGFAITFLFIGNFKNLNDFINTFRMENPKNASEWLSHIFYLCLFSLPYVTYKALEKRFSFLLTKLFFGIGFVVAFILFFGVFIPLLGASGLLDPMDNL